MSFSSGQWDLLAAYLAVVRTGSLSGAARSLGLSQPTVRRQIEVLERQSGTPLFTRSASGLEPIAGSEALISEAEAMEAAAAAFARFASAPAAAVSGTVRIACPAVFAVEILPPILAAIRRDWPALELEFSVSNAVEDLLRREADIAVRLVRPTQSALVIRRVAPIDIGFFAAPGPVADRAAGMDYAALSESGLLIGQDRDCTIAEGLSLLGLPPPRKVSIRIDDDLTQLAAIRAGAGVGVTQASIAARHGLVRICPDIRLPIETWLAMHEDQRTLARVRTVFDALAAGLA